MLKLVAFGSDSNYILYAQKSIEIIENNLRGYEISSNFYNKEMLPRSINDLGSKYKRGYGYWIWKPWIILDILNKSSIDDIILYFDARGIFDKKGLPLLKNIITSLHKDKDFALWQLPGIEREWTKSSLLNRYGLDKYSYSSNTFQFGDSFIAFKVNKRTISFFDNLYQQMSNNLTLLDDTTGKNGEDIIFIENRHSQSFFSLEIKKYIQDNGSDKIMIFNNKDLILFDFPYKSHSFLHPENLRSSIIYRISPKSLKKVFKFVYINSAFLRKFINKFSMK
jgi:hypothetical protein